jgi:type IV pilus assembly protein PilB
LRRSGLRLLREGKTDIEAVSKVIDMTYTDE